MFGRSSMGFLSRFFRLRQHDVPRPADPRAAEIAKNRGNDHLAKAEFDQAAECYREAIRLLPSYAEAYVNLGFVFKEQKRYAEAESILLQAVALKPSLWQAHFNLGVVAQETDRPDEAVSHYQHVLGMSPSYRESHPSPEAHWRLADIYVAKERHGDVLRVMEDLIAFDPALVEAQCNLGTALHKLGRNEEALAQYERVVAMSPQNAVASHCLGVVHQELGHWDKARECYGRARALDPGHFDAQRDETILSLLLGNYENGWIQYEKMLPGLHGKDKKQETDAQFFRRKFTPEKYWQGDDLAGRTLLIWTEQGLGDTLMMLRYLPLLKARGAGKIIIHCEQALVRIVRDLPEADEVVPKPGKVDDLRFDRHCSTMSFPFIFDTRLDTIPNRVPYISVPEEGKAKWAGRVAGRPGLRVGLAWGGNKKLQQDRQRSIPLKDLAPLLEVAGVTWISLQKGEPAEQLKDADWPLVDWMNECQDMQDTGALMENLDLVITVDTSVVHLAGALGRPTWLLNRYNCDWRWLLEREDSPWYPSVRIFRQPVLNDWDSVIARVAAELRSLVRR